MAYTRDWNTEVLGKPVGSRASSEIDDAIREFKVDLDERLQDVVRDSSADPWVLKVPGVSGDGSQNYTVHPVSGVVFGNVGMDVDSARSVQPLAAGQNGTWAGPLPVPRGSQVKAVSFRVKCDAGATVICRVINVTEDGVRTVLASDSPVADGALHWALVSGLTALLDSGNIVYLEVFLGANGSSATSAMFLWADVVIQTAGTF